MKKLIALAIAATAFNATAGVPTKADIDAKFQEEVATIKSFTTLESLGQYRLDMIKQLDSYADEAGKCKGKRDNYCIAVRYSHKKGVQLTQQVAMSQAFKIVNRDDFTLTEENKEDVDIICSSRVEFYYTNYKTATYGYRTASTIEDSKHFAELQRFYLDSWAKCAEYTGVTLY